MDLNHLPLFVAVAESGSLSAAARRLGQPKSTVSRGLSALERSLGVQLLHRTTRQVRLTSAGEAFLPRARAVTQQAREAVDALPERAETPSGTLRITAAVDLGLSLLPRWCALFTARYPEVRLDVQLSNVNEDLVGRQFDVALRIAKRLPSSTLVARRLATLHFQLYAAPSYLARQGTPRSLEDLAQHQRVALRVAERALPSLPAPRVSTDDVMFAWQLIREGVGVGALPRFLPVTDVEQGALVPVLPRWSKEGGHLYFVHPPAAHLARKVAAFRDFLLERLRTAPLERAAR